MEATEREGRARVLREGGREGEEGGEGGKQELVAVENASLETETEQGNNMTRRRAVLMAIVVRGAVGCGWERYL
jgi:hypothetical protein